MMIYEDVKGRILSGEYEVGAQIPDEKTVCQNFGCSRMTVKKAYDMLVMEGLIYRKQGQGSFVLSSKINRPEVEIQERELVGFTKATNGEGTSKVLRFQLMFATEKIAKALNIHVNDPVYDICRVRLLNDRPYVIEQTYMSPAVIPGLTLDILNHSIYSYIENDLGLRIGAAQKTTSADISLSHSVRRILTLTLEGIQSSSKTTSRSQAMASSVAFIIKKANSRKQNLSV